MGGAFGSQCSSWCGGRRHVCVAVQWVFHYDPDGRPGICSPGAWKRTKGRGQAVCQGRCAAGDFDGCAVRSSMPCLYRSADRFFSTVRCRICGNRDSVYKDHLRADPFFVFEFHIDRAVYSPGRFPHSLCGQLCGNGGKHCPGSAVYLWGRSHTGDAGSRSGGGNGLFPDHCDRGSGGVYLKEPKGCR